MSSCDPAGRARSHVPHRRDQGEAPRPPAWVEDFCAGTVRLIGTMEILGAVGLSLPAATGITPILTPLAATCLDDHGTRRNRPGPACGALRGRRQRRTASPAPGRSVGALRPVLSLIAGVPTRSPCPRPPARCAPGRRVSCAPSQTHPPHRICTRSRVGLADQARGPGLDHRVPHSAQQRGDGLGRLGACVCSECSHLIVPRLVGDLGQAELFQ
jgi:hypothetical protein